MTRPSFGSSDMPAVFPDWSPYQDLDSAARAYLRDPEVALDALFGVLRGASVLCFTLERFVNEVNGVWQEVVICDGSRLVLWHGEDVPPSEGPPGSMTSSLRVVALSAVTEVGCRRRLSRTAGGHVRVDPDETAAIAAFLGIDEATLMRRFVQQDGRTLKDGMGSRCVFLKDGPHVACSIYPVRPQQCRTWPFWPEALADPELLASMRRTCPGIVDLPPA